MRRDAVILAGIIGLAGATPAGAQYYGGVPTGRILLPGCYNPDYRPNPRHWPNIIPDADKTLDKYLGLARSASNLDKMFTGRRENRTMTINGVSVDARTARDPWASRVAKLEPVGYVQSNEEMNMHAQWRALASDGTLIGTYDLLIRAGVGGYHIRQLKLVSAGSQPEALKSFCMTPGDVEKWQSDKAAKEA